MWIKHVSIQRRTKGGGNVNNTPPPSTDDDIRGDPLNIGVIVEESTREDVNNLNLWRCPLLRKRGFLSKMKLLPITLSRYLSIYLCNF